jgi:hypothetical protein
MAELRSSATHRFAMAGRDRLGPVGCTFAMRAGDPVRYRRTARTRFVKRPRRSVAAAAFGFERLMAALIEETALPRHELVVWGK